MPYAFNAELERLRTEFAARGVGSPTAPAAAWEAFKAFGRGLETSHDGRDRIGLLVQFGTYDFSGQPRFYFDPLCQFELSDQDDEFLGYEQLHCELSCAPTPATAGIQANLWSFDFADVEAYYSAVEAMPEFRVAMALPSYDLAIGLDSV